MRYMLLCYDDEKAWEKKGKAALLAAMDEAVGLCREIDAKGQYQVAAPLHPEAEAISVKVRDGKRLVTDGPFAETHEHLGGFYLLDVDSVEEAINIAARHPGAPLGTVIVRRVIDLPGLPNNTFARQSNANR